MSVKRRTQIIQLLKEASQPISASALAKTLKVSRQIIVGDVALLRAAGEEILATPRGYAYRKMDAAPFGYIGIVPCRHDAAQLIEELYTVVDFGGTLIDVTIEHPLYGQISGSLDISSRYDADSFVQNASRKSGRPLSELTGGVHLHKIGCKDEETFLLIKQNLQEKNILYS